MRRKPSSNKVKEFVKAVLCVGSKDDEYIEEVVSALTCLLMASSSINPGTKGRRCNKSYRKQRQ